MISNNFCREHAIRAAAGLLLIAVAVVLLFAAPAGSSEPNSESSSESKIAPLVFASENKDGKVPVIVVLKEQSRQPSRSGKLSKIEAANSMRSLATASQMKIMSSMQQEAALGNADDISNLYLVNAIAVKASPSAIKRLALLDEVVRIEPDIRVRAAGTEVSSFSDLVNHPPVREKDIERDAKPTYPNYTAWGIRWIEAPRLWERGINGSGVNISIIDTGIAHHPDIADRIIAFKDFVKYIPYNGSRVFYSGKGANLTHTMERNFSLGDNPGIEFFSKYDLNYRSNYTTGQITYLDFGYVSISVDGLNWIDLRTFKGTSNGYLKETIDLSEYRGRDVKIRFTLVTSDESNSNGWYLDDIKIKDGSSTAFFDGAEAGMSWDADGWTVVADKWVTGSMWYSGTGYYLSSTLDQTFNFSGLSTVTLNFTTRYDTETGYDFGKVQVMDRSSRAWYSGKGNNLDNILERSFDLSSVDNATLNFRTWYTTESCCDIGYVQVSTDRSRWTALRTYSGDSTPVYESINLTPYAGNSNLSVRFYYQTDGSVSYKGWYVDDISLPQIGFYDSAEDGERDWLSNGWSIAQIGGWDTIATYSGYSAYKNQSFNLGNYSGKTNVTLRFLYTTNWYSNHEGWYVDEIRIPELGFYDPANSIGNWSASGWEIAGPDAPYDDNGHGTHVAGTAAGNGKMGINTGAAPGANLIGAKVLDDTGSGYSSDIIRAIEWSYENNADVISLSLGILPVDRKENSEYNIINTGSTAVENITVFSNPFVDSPLKTASPDAFQPASIISSVAAYTKNDWWETNTYWETYLQRSIDLSNTSSATLNFSTLYSMSGTGYVQVSSDEVNWTTLDSYNSSDLAEEQYWKNVSLNLSSYAGSNITLRFYHAYSGYYDLWKIDNISIPEIGFYDVDSTGWDADGWDIITSYDPVPVSSLNISLKAPDGSTVKGDPVNWWNESDKPPPNIWLYKYTGDNPLQAGIWNLTITSNYSRPVYYYYLLLVTYPSDGSDAISTALNRAADQGIVPVVAAGNEGYLGLYSIDAPGASSKAITAGAIDNSQDYIAPFSSRGPVGFGSSRIIKPDVVAPGSNITSLNPGNWYGDMSGTSMAASHVSGTVALMLQRNPDLAPWQVKHILMNSSIDLGAPGKDNTYGSGRISAYAAAVNASSEPLSQAIPQRANKYELFAGAIADDMILKPFISDATEDVSDSSIDIRGASIYKNYWSNGIQIKIFTVSAPDLNNSEFYIYLDMDKDASTGWNINGIGADYEIKINRTGSGYNSRDTGYLYRINGTQLDFIQGLNTYVLRYDRAISISLYLDLIDQPVSGFYGVIYSNKGTLTDIAPDSGYGIYPYASIPIKMIGISWNDTSGTPEAGMNLTFRVEKYNNSDGYTTLNTTTLITDSSGMVSMGLLVDQISSWDTYYTYISDEAGNSISDTVYVYTEGFFIPEEPPFIIPVQKNYTAIRNATLPVKITLLTPEWQPYTNNVTLVFGYPENSDNISVELTPIDGTIEYDLNLSETALDDYCDTCSISVSILNGTLKNNDYESRAGDVIMGDTNQTAVDLSPTEVSALPGSKIDFLVESYQIKHENNVPVRRDLVVSTSWIREVDVKALGEKLSSSILGKLYRMRTYTLGKGSTDKGHTDKGRTDNLLTGNEIDELNRVLSGLPKNIGINYTEFNIRTDNTGIASFNITVPAEDVYYGIIAVRGNDDRPYDNAYVFVSPQQQSQRQNQDGETFQRLNIGVNWNANKIGDTWAADNSFTINLSLREYNSSSERDLPGERIYLYTTTGETKVATTGTNGTAKISFTAPQVEIANTSCYQLCHSGQVQVWGITRFQTSRNKTAVAESGLGYLRTNGMNRNYTQMDTGIINNNLDIVVRYKNNGNDAANVPFIVDAYGAALGDGQRSVSDLISSFVNSPAGVYHALIPLSRYGTYSAVSSVEYKPPLWRDEGWGSSTLDQSQVTFTPFAITAYISPRYPGGVIQPVVVSVKDLNNTAVQGDSIYLIERLDSEVSSSPWGYIDINKTDSSGNAVLMLRTPDIRNARVNYRIGGATDNITFPYIRQGSFEIREAKNMPDLKPVIDMLPVIEAGKEITIGGIIYNPGDIPSNRSVLSIYVNNVLLANTSTGIIPNGSYAPFAQVWMPAITGNYEIKAVADAANTNNELDETNNVDVISVTSSLPDLVPEIIVPAKLQVGSTIDIDVRVRNTGGITAPVSSLLVQINTANHNANLNTSTIPVIPPGGFYTARVAWTPWSTGNYTIRAVSDSTGIINELSESNNEAAASVEVLTLPDLTVSLNIPQEARVNTTVNLSAKVMNSGTTSSNETALSIYEDALLIQNITVPALNAGGTGDYVVQWTPTTVGTKLIRAVIDSNDNTKESNEGNNADARWIRIGERDLQVFIDASSKAIMGINETAWIYVTKYGNLRTEATNLTVDVSTGNRAVFDVPSLYLQGETRIYSVNVPISRNTRKNITINASIDPVDEANTTNNYASRIIEGIDLNLTINHVWKPGSQVWANTSFWTGVRFSSNANTAVNATIQLRDGLTLPAWESRTKTVNAWAADLNWVGWSVTVPDDSGTYGYNITISAYNANDTASGSVSTSVPLATLKDFNSTAVKHGDNKIISFASLNVTSIRSDYSLAIMGGSEGRILDGLEYLFDYPYGCVEQTSSLILAGLSVKGYYERTGKWNNKSESTKTVISNRILNGLQRLRTMQASSSAFAVWGKESGDDTLPTIYAYYAVSSALLDSDPVISSDASVANMNVSRIASWVVEHQEPDGSWLSRYEYASYYTKPVLTGMALVDYNVSYLFLDDSVKTMVDKSRRNAIMYLLNSQQQDGSWLHRGIEDPYTTGSGLLGLAYSENRSASVTDAMNTSVDWLKSKQGESGYWEGAAIYRAWSSTGIRSETTAVVMQALLASGVPSDDPAIIKAANYLMGVYESDGSWGSTKTIQEAIQALLKVTAPEDINLSVTVSINGISSEYSINNTNRIIVDITGNAACLDSINRICQNTVAISANGNGSAIVSAGGTQVIRYREKDLLPAKYVDSIDEDMILRVNVGAGIKGEPAMVNLSVINPTGESIFSPILSIPLESAALSGNIIDNTGSNVTYAVMNNTLHIFPVIIENHTTENYLFNLTFNGSGYHTIQAELSPMYNPALLTHGNGTGYIKGRGNLSFTVYDGYGGLVSPSINISGIAGSNLAYANLVESRYDVKISGQDYIDILSHVDVFPDIERSYIVRMFRTLSQPEVVQSEYDARPAFIKTSTSASTGMIRYDMTVSAKSRGTATVAMTVPENLYLSRAEVDSQVILPEMFNNTVYISADTGDGSVISLLFRYRDSTSTICMVDAQMQCNVKTSESEVEIHSAFNASAGEVVAKINSNASAFSADGSPLKANTTGLSRYLNITYSNLTFDWAVIRMFYYADETADKSINESSLRIYWYNYSNNSWHVLENGSDYRNSGPYVYSAGIIRAANTGRGHVWANITHFSTFAIAGEQAIALVYNNGSATSPSGSGSGPGGSNGNINDGGSSSGGSSDSGSGGRSSSSGGGSSSSSGSGDSSGIATSEQYDNIVKAERYDKDLIANIPVVYTYTAPEHGIYEIAATGRENENDIAIRVEALKETSRQIKQQAPGVVYRNINIRASTKNIRDALIRFKIENSWITSSGLASEDVKMLIWDGIRWVQLETAEKTKDAFYTYYEAKIDTFSSFAISGLKDIEVQTAASTVTVNKMSATPAATVIQPLKPHRIPAWGYVSAAVATITAYFFAKKRQKPEEQYR